jgi:aminotransferase in exopolysaccharide biosynthesis
MSDFIPLSIPSIGGNEWKYIKECLDTGWVSSVGPFVNRFEDEFAQYTGARHAVATVNGTAALHVALGIAGVTPGDEVMVPTITFIAPINAVRYCQAEPVFMDCDEYFNIDVENVRSFLENETVMRNGSCWNKSTNRRIGAVVPVHVFGNAVRMEELMTLCEEHSIPVVEDATESLGTRYNSGRYAGRHAGTIGRIGCFSFNGNKIITTGGGGMIVTEDESIARKAKYLTTQAKDDELHFIHGEVGYNYRLTNIQAAMGVAQLERMPGFLETKKRNYNAYKSALDGVPGLHVAEAPPYADNNLWMYALQIDAGVYGKDVDETIDYLSSHRMQARPVWHPNHMQKPYASNQAWRIENAGRMQRTAVNIPCSVDLTLDDVDRVVDVILGKR